MATSLDTVLALLRAINSGKDQSAAADAVRNAPASRAAKSLSKK